ncbi:class I SAM-dependent methyltransferase [Rhizorhabdus histidinilytica]|uniref:Methyltransferase domain-containing protein n=1 Tax=Rhizorhabdus histidinilytica TaxID=439228 RepID=A0A1T4ZW26_9SPHN|nr:class I SAM-dependent methyltransferase [Rhizorhabdus histidinilytica]SKB26807.1 Methyltransferase domain-containing protein [Rhizorhabdus histidinilytica]
MDERLETAARHWSIERRPDRSRWWMHETIIRHINRLVCGEAIDGIHQGFHRLIRDRIPEGGFRRALSVGCGSGGKEMRLLKQGIVQSFDLFEIGEHRREQIRSKAAEHGLEDRITIHIGDAFQEDIVAGFDLVYWNNALHHMFDAKAAVSWSRRALQPGGWFAMDDFVGATRFQWSDEDLEIASRVRSLLPERFLAHPRNPEKLLPRRLERPSIATMLEVDPTEAADSGNIVNAIRDAFPDTTITPTGGVVYHLALNDVLNNFDPEDDALLNALLLLDEVLASGDHNQYAVALAEKN